MHTKEEKYRKLAEQFPSNIKKYIEGKNDYMKSIDIKAEKWKKLRASFASIKSRAFFRIPIRL